MRGGEKLPVLDLFLNVVPIAYADRLDQQSQRVVQSDIFGLGNSKNGVSIYWMKKTAEEGFGGRSLAPFWTY